MPNTQIAKSGALMLGQSLGQEDGGATWMDHPIRAQGQASRGKTMWPPSETRGRGASLVLGIENHAIRNAADDSMYLRN